MLSFIDRLAANVEALEKRVKQAEAAGWKPDTLARLRGELHDARADLEAEQRRLLDPAAKVRY